MGDEVKYLYTALAHYLEINNFLEYTEIDDYNRAYRFLGNNQGSVASSRNKIAERIICKDDQLMKEFFYAGMKSFLSANVPGDQETFYMHFIGSYILKISRETYRCHGQGVGIYTMEGFEAISYFTK